MSGLPDVIVECQQNARTGSCVSFEREQSIQSTKYVVCAMLHSHSTAYISSKYLPST